MAINGHEPKIPWPTQIQKNVFLWCFFAFFLQKFIDVDNHIISSANDITPTKSILISKGVPFEKLFFEKLGR